jgi:3-methyladenine DNA glycosylase AlkD
MPKDADVFSREVHSCLATQADATRSTAMAAYMKNQFSFFGVPTPLRRKLIRPLFTGLCKQPGPAWFLAVAEALWQFDERECQYVAVDMLVKQAANLDASQEGRLSMLVRSKPWWDTIDALATHVYGNLVGRSPALWPVMDAYAQHEDSWLRRVAILHQLHYGAGTDTERLSRTLDANLEHPDFFIRKAIGWALRQYARTNPDWVRQWITEHAARVSTLTRREAMKHLREA